MLNQKKQEWKKPAKLQLETSQLLHFSLPIYSHSMPRPWASSCLGSQLKLLLPLALYILLFGVLLCLGLVKFFWLKLLVIPLHSREEAKVKKRKSGEHH